MILPVTLAAAAACAIINFWLAIRTGMARRAANVSIGDGGDSRLISRMRAHANFVEYSPFVLILLVVIELAIGTHWWLWTAAALFVIGRILHPLGMDSVWKPGRAIGVALTFAILLGLAGVAATIPFFSYGTVETIEVVEAAA
nr:MAPEG family protein [Sphingomonas turrisvirgatae]